MCTPDPVNCHATPKSGTFPTGIAAESARFADKQIRRRPVFQYADRPWFDSIPVFDETPDSCTTIAHRPGFQRIARCFRHSETASILFAGRFHPARWRPRSLIDYPASLNSGSGDSVIQVADLVIQPERLRLCDRCDTVAWQEF